MPNTQEELVCKLVCDVKIGWMKGDYGATETHQHIESTPPTSKDIADIVSALILNGVTDEKIY